MDDFRQMSHAPLFIGLSVALILAVGVLVFGAGRIIYGIARDCLRERKPARKIQHPDLGLLTADGNLWMGEVQCGGRGIPFVVGGTESAPDESRLAQVQDLLQRLPDLDRRAVEFLRSREPEIRQARVEFYELDVTEQEHGDDFTLEFVADGDGDRVWRVKFEDGLPKSTGFDD